MIGFASIGGLSRVPYILVGDWLDRWYEELPWRRRLAVGKRGEQIARRYLRRRGYIILAANYRAAGAEIDLVAFDRETLVFIEVKAREHTAVGTPREAVDEHKQQQIRRAADAYVAARRATGLAVRFDVVAMVGTGRGRKIELLKDAF
jgi:putative endonuclease